MKRQRLRHIPILFLVWTLLGGCNFPFTEDDPSPENPATLAARTLEVVRTHVGSGTELPVQEFTPQLTPETNGVNSAVSEDGCINKAFFLDDITIRDSTLIEHGTSFVKVWRLRNDGTCIWNQNYRLVFIGGERMSAPQENSLQQVIQPGQTVDLSVDMTAPDKPGRYHGFWRLQSDKGATFGIGSNGDQSFWVQITVISSLTRTPTAITTPAPSATNTVESVQTPSPTVTPTPTVTIHSQGSSSLSLDQSINLDDGEISPQNGADFLFTETSPGEPFLNPQNGARMGIYPDDTPPTNSEGCQNTTLAEDPISISALAVDDIICYSTDDGRLGYLTLTEISSSVSFAFTTWGP